MFKSCIPFHYRCFVPCRGLVAARGTAHQACVVPICPHFITTSRRAYKSILKTKPAPILPSDTKSPADDYYALLLEQPFVSSAVTDIPTAIPLAQSSKSIDSPTQPETKLEKARIIFGSKLVGPGMRQKYIEDLPSLEASGQGTYIAGVWIPPKPTEPDNCCMSGCVNCVWDGYREELEEWINRKKDARALAAKRHDDAIDDTGDRGEEDGMNSGEWSLDSAMNDIPVGIREFMKTEKRLQQQRAAT